MATPASFTISSDPAWLDFDVIHAFLSTCYWSKGIPRALVEKAARHSLCFGAYQIDRPRSPSSPLPAQVGYARIISDHATYAYLCDVFVLEPFRGLGLSKRLMESVISHPELQGLRRIALFTRDAHGLYAQFGFQPMPDPTRYLERHTPNAYAPPVVPSSVPQTAAARA